MIADDSGVFRVSESNTAFCVMQWGSESNTAFCVIKWGGKSNTAFCVIQWGRESNTALCVMFASSWVNEKKINYVIL